MAQNAVVVTGRFSYSGDDAGLVMATTREARLRTGESREEFARTVNRRAKRPLQLGAGSIEAYETGYAQPVADVWMIILAVGGMDVAGILTRWLYG